MYRNERPNSYTGLRLWKTHEGGGGNKPTKKPTNSQLAIQLIKTHIHTPQIATHTPNRHTHAHPRHTHPTPNSQPVRNWLNKWHFIHMTQCCRCHYEEWYIPTLLIEQNGTHTDLPTHTYTHILYFYYLFNFCLLSVTKLPPTLQNFIIKMFKHPDKLKGQHMEHPYTCLLDVAN